MGLLCGLKTACSFLPTGEAALCEAKLFSGLGCHRTGPLWVLDAADKLIASQCVNFSGTR